MSVVGGAIGAMHIPEKWFPGCMDYYLNSHNIMHVLVVLAVYSMHQVGHGESLIGVLKRLMSILYLPGHGTGLGLDVESGVPYGHHNLITRGLDNSVKH